MTRLAQCLFGTVFVGALAQAELPKSENELFSLNKVWDVQLTFGPGQWEALEPKGGGGGMFGGPGRGGPGGPGGPGGGFNPTRFLAPMWLSALDQNKDGAVAKDEFLGKFNRWSTEWDTKKEGFLTTDSIREGMNKSFTMGGPGGPGGGFVPRLLASDGKRNGLSGASGMTFEYVHADLAFAGSRLTNVAVRYKGNGTYMGARMSDKKSLKLDLNEFTKAQKLAGVSKLNLHNNVTDASWMNEPLSYALYRDAGVPAPRTSYARVRVSAPGAHTNDYLGLYSIVENPDSNWAEAHFGTKKGAIFKPVTPTLFRYLGDDWKAYNQIYDPKTDLTEKQKRRVQDFAKLLTDANDADLARRLPEFLDVDEFSRFMAVTVWLSTLDSILTLGQNYVVYLHPKTDKFLFLPWDLDHSFGNFGMQGSQDEREQLSIKKPWSGENRFFERVMGVPAVKEAYLARLKEFQGTIFRPERLTKQVDDVAKLIRDAVKDEAPEKLERFDKVVAGEAVGMMFGGGGPRGGDRGPGPGGPGGGPGGPGGGRGGPGFGQPAKPIKGFVPARHASVAEQLAGKSDGLPIGGRGGPGGPGGRGGFGPGMFLAQPITQQADADKDEKVTAKELNALAEKWWNEWDSAKAGSLNEQQLSDGLVKAFPMPPGFGGPGGPGGGPGGPGGPRPRD